MNNVFSGWIEGQFGKWKDLILSVLMSIAVFTAIIVTCGCCCIPCIRTLVNRLITTALTKETPHRMRCHLLGAPEEEAIPGLPLPLAQRRRPYQAFPFLLPWTVRMKSTGIGPWSHPRPPPCPMVQALSLLREGTNLPLPIAPVPYPYHPMMDEGEEVTKYAHLTRLRAERSSPLKRADA